MDEANLSKVVYLLSDCVSQWGVFATQCSSGEGQTPRPWREMAQATQHWMPDCAALAGGHFNQLMWRSFPEKLLREERSGALEVAESSLDHRPPCHWRCLLCCIQVFWKVPCPGLPVSGSVCKLFVWEELGSPWTSEAPSAASAQHCHKNSPS